MDESDRIVAPLAPGPTRLVDDDGAAVDDPAFRRLLDLAREHGASLRWIAIDDVDDATCELAISPWPRLTPDGRLTFAREEAEHIVADVDAGDLAQLVRASRRRYATDREARALAERPLRVGDAFAALIDLDDAPERAPAGGGRTTIRFPFGPEGIVDVTTDARRFAKIQAALANAPPLESEQVVPPGGA